MRSRAGFFALALVAGCFDDLSGIKVNHDLGSNSDAFGGGSNDGGGGGACALPHLQVAVRDVRSWSGVVRKGQVLRIPLDGRKPCAPLDLQGSLDPAPTALGFLPPSTTVYGEVDGKVRFLAPDNTEVQAPYSPTETRTPDAIFSLLDDQDRKRLVIAYDITNDPIASTISYLDVLDPTDLSKRTHRWALGVDDPAQLLRVTSTDAVDADPRDAHRVLAFREKYPTDPTVALVAPWDGQPSLPIDFVASLASESRPRQLRTSRAGTTSRFVWVFEERIANGAPNRVVHRLEQSGSAPKQWGPIACTNQTQCTEPLQIADAIPDFTDDNAVLATCYVEHSDVTNESTSNVIRIHSNGQCDTLFRGETLIESQWLLSLAAAIE